MSKHPLAIRCADGYRLRALEFHPRQSRGVTVIVAAAMMVRRRFYTRFAAWMAEHGVHAVTFANRGSGESLALETGSWDHRLEHWGQLDLPAVIEHVRAERPRDRIFVVGHSMGGQIVGLTESLHDLDGVITVAATAAWWGNWPLPDRLWILAWHTAIPLIGRALPIFPAGRLGLGPDTRSEVVRGWAKWGRHPAYLYGPFGLEHHTATYEGRVLAYSFTDDEHFGCLHAVEALHERFTAAEVTMDHVDPRRFGVRSIGHFGYFQAGVGTPVWSHTLDWITGGSPAPR